MQRQDVLGQNAEELWAILDNKDLLPGHGASLSKRL